LESVFRATALESLGLLTDGEEFIITEKSLPVARLVLPQYSRPQPIPRRGKGTITILSDDDEHLEDFKEYRP
jgi:antitoxin (DNA-binding transcriptional repressor) of toxin-antitoxin stability system